MDYSIGKQDLDFMAQVTKKYLELKVPDLGDTDKIELIKWYVKEGASVEEGQEILELVTDKAAFPVESPFSGKLERVIVSAGAIVERNEVLGILEY